MLELGWQVKPNNGPVTIDLGVTGWAGKQRGGSVQLGIRMPDRLWLEHDLIAATAKTIGERTKLLTVTGTR